MELDLYQRLRADIKELRESLSLMKWMVTVIFVVVVIVPVLKQLGWWNILGIGE